MVYNQNMLDSEFNSMPEERPAAAAIGEQIEVSTGFQPEQLILFFWRIIPHIQEDFGKEEVHHLIEIIDSLKLNEVVEKKYSVTFRGRRIPLQICLYRYEPETIGLYVTSTWILAREIEDEMKKFQAEFVVFPEGERAL